MRILRFNESKLTIADLEKEDKVGNLRGDLLVKKLKDQIEDPEDDSSYLTFNKGNSKVKATTVNAEDILDNITDGDDVYDTEKARRFFVKNTRYVNKFDTGEDIFKLNDVEKTKDLGSSGGSSLGSHETRNVESLQCLFCALRQNLNRDITKNDKDLLYDEYGHIKADILDYTKVVIELDSELVEYYFNKWSETFISTANSLYQNRELYTKDKRSGSILNTVRKYTFYQIGYKGGIIEAINNSYKRFSEVRGIPISKWTPSDMWAIVKDRELDIIRRINSCRTIGELNVYIDRYFDRKDLVGVSLKKVKNITNNKLLINKVTPKPRYIFEKIRTSTDPFSSLGIYVILKQYSDLEDENNKLISLNLRTFDSTKLYNISGEVIGESARHGKIGLAKINSIFEKINKNYGQNIQLVPYHPELSDINLDWIKNEIIKLNEICDDKVDSRKKEDTKNELIRAVSKYQSLLVAKNLKEVDQKYADEICQRMMYYALAIENDTFECPKYVRII